MFNGKTHYKWPFSIAMLNYQRVCFLKNSEVILPFSIPMTSSHWGWQQSVSEPQGEPCKAAVAAIVPVHCPAHGEASWSTKKPLPRFLDPSHWGPVFPQNKGGWFWRYPHCGPQIRREKVSVGRLNAPEVATKQTFHHSPGLAHLQDSVERSQLKAARCVHESQPKLTAEERFGRYNFWGHIGHT